MSDTRGRSPALDLVTVVAMGLVAYGVANVVHEGVGHGGACVLVGGRSIALSTAYFDCDASRLSSAAPRWVDAAGALLNLAVGVLAFALLRRAPRDNTPGRYFLWLLMTINLMQGTGYWLYSGAADTGDWATVIRGMEPHGIWRAALVLAGVVGYWATVWLSLRELVPLLGASPGRVKRAVVLSVIPYVAGGVLNILGGIFNPYGFLLVLISSAPSSLGGTSGLTWMAQLLRNERLFPPSSATPLSLPRSWPWLAGATAFAVVFVVVLGRSIRF
jgi:hypothetical protein